MRILLLLMAAVLCAPGTIPASPSVGPLATDLPEPYTLEPYTEPFAPDAEYDPAIPHPNELLGFELGARPASPEQLFDAFKRLAEASPRVRLIETGFSYEGRPLSYAIVTSPENQSRLDEIEQRLGSLADPASSGRESSSLIETLPAVVWVGGPVHGDEASGGDAALALLYHFAADQNEATRRILSQTILLIDPVQNPDGRAHHLDDVDRWATRIPNLDRQSRQHRDSWPSARGNHYLLDLNRDWFALSQTETRSRVGVLLRWHPQVTIDLHEMGSFDTYLFSPPREPYNAYLPGTTKAWWNRFSKARSRAFGEHGWSCYTGDWNEEFNPNRGAAWPLFIGAIAMLHEQATTDGSAIALPVGSVRRYREAVHHQFVATLAVLEEVAAGRQDLLRDYRQARREILAGRSEEPWGYLIDTQKNPAAAHRLARTLTAQGIDVRRSLEPLRGVRGTDYWGEPLGGRAMPAGSYLIPLRQPEGRLVRTILDFDPTIGSAFLTKERQQRESGGSTLLYESSAWSLAMAYGAEVYLADTKIGIETEPFLSGSRRAGQVHNPDAPYGFLFDTRQEGATIALAQLLSAGHRVHATSEPLRAGGHNYVAGTPLLRAADNSDDLPSQLDRLAKRFHVDFFGLDHALTEAGPDLGSRAVRLLQPPRVALISGSPFYQTTFGAVWFFLDQELGLPVSILRTSGIATADLEKYNVLIFPDASSGKGMEIHSALGEPGMAALTGWVQRGGTLITLGESSWIQFAGEEPWTSLRAVRQVLPDLEAYRQEARIEATLLALSVDEEKLRTGSPDAIDRPPIAIDAVVEPITPEQDERLRRFAPHGAILRANLNDRHWLASGVGGRVPVIVRTDLALVAKQPVETIGRFADASSVRLSGLLWPEGRGRIALTSYLTREKIGKGQVISFLGNPIYRAYFHGTGRLLANAILLGPGMGTAVRSGY